MQLCFDGIFKYLSQLHECCGKIQHKFWWCCDSLGKTNPLRCAPVFRKLLSSLPSLDTLFCEQMYIHNLGCNNSDSEMAYDRKFFHSKMDCGNTFHCVSAVFFYEKIYHGFNMNDFDLVSFAFANSWRIILPYLEIKSEIFSSHQTIRE